MESSYKSTKMKKEPYLIKNGQMTCISVLQMINKHMKDAQHN